MKKRTIALVLAAMLALSLLTGCGGKENPAVETQAPATEALQDKELSLGVWEGYTYTNSYAGIGCTLDGSWVAYAADQLQELPNTVRDMMEGSELGDAMANVTQFTDMYAENAQLMVNMNILFQKQDLQQRITYAGMDELDVLEATLSQKDLLVDGYAQAGIMVEDIQIVKVTFLGEEHYAMKTVAQTQGVGYYCLQLFDFWLGEYSATITFASFVEDNTESMLDLFFAVD